jgi:hypothetical protein
MPFLKKAQGFICISLVLISVAVQLVSVKTVLAKVPEVVLSKKLAVVTIVTTDNNKKVYSGTGFIVSLGETALETFIVTNSHVLSKFDSTKNMTLDILASNGDKLTYVRTLYEDKAKDLAVLAVKEKNLPTIKLSTKEIKQGDDVYVIGSPMGIQSTVSDGIVSNLLLDENLIQITAPISVGSSGSPVLDSDGDAIGIATLIMKNGQNLNFAIPLLSKKEEAPAPEPAPAPMKEEEPVKYETPVVSKSVSATIKKLLSNKKLWSDLAWNNIYKSAFFKSVKWNKISDADVARRFNVKKDGVTADAGVVVSAYQNNFEIDGEIFEVTIQDRQRKTLTSSVYFSKAGEPFAKNREISNSVYKFLKKTYGEPVYNDTTKYNMAQDSTVTFETKQWQVGKSIFNLSVVSFTDPGEDKIMTSVSISNAKTNPANKPNILLSCAIKVGDRTPRSQVFVIKNDDKLNKVKLQNHYHNALSSTVYDKAIELRNTKEDGDTKNDQDIVFSISRIDGSINGSATGKNNMILPITGKCEKVTDSKNLF